jgi:hypothetical protein
MQVAGNDTRRSGGGDVHGASRHVPAVHCAGGHLFSNSQCRCGADDHPAGNSGGEPVG